MKIPLQFEVPPSSPYNETANLQYKQLAQKAEIAVPQTWWREGFADEKLLLTKNLDYLPKKLLNVSIKSNGKLKILYHCVSLPHFLRQSYDYASYKPTTHDNPRLIHAKQWMILWSRLSLHYGISIVMIWMELILSEETIKRLSGFLSARIRIPWPKLHRMYWNISMPITLHRTNALVS